MKVVMLVKVAMQTAVTVLSGDTEGVDADDGGDS